MSGPKFLLTLKKRHLALITQALYIRKILTTNSPFTKKKDNRTVLGVECPNTYFKFPCILDVVFEVARLGMAVPRSCIY